MSTCIRKLDYTKGEPDTAEEAWLVPMDNIPPLGKPPTAAGEERRGAASLKDLELAVESACEEIRRIDELRLRAVWINILSNRTKGEQPFRFPEKSKRTGKPLSVEQRRANLRQRNFFSEVDTTTATAPSVVQPGGKPPFLPPNRFPSLPPLSTADYDHFNYTISQSILSASHEGTRSFRRRREVGDTSTASKRTLSLRHAIQAHGGVENDKRVTPAVPVPPTEEEREKVEEVPSSLSLLILDIAKQRALATLFLRQARLESYRRKMFLNEIQVRYNYYVKRRLLQHWLLAAEVSKQAKVEWLYVLVEKWRSYARMKVDLRERMIIFRDKLRERANALSRLQHVQTHLYFQKWRAAHARHHFRRSLYSEADLFYGQAREKHPRYAAVFETEREGLSVAGDRLVRKRIFDHWMNRLRSREVLYGVDQLYRVNRQKTVIRTFAKRFGAHYMHREEAKENRTNEIKMLADRVAAETDGAPRAARVYVAEKDSSLTVLKEKCAARVEQGRLLRRAFTLWVERYENKMVNAFRDRHVRLTVMRTWVLRTFHRVELKRQRNEVWQAIQSKSKDALMDRVADTAYTRCLIVPVWRTWRNELSARRWHRFHLAAKCLRRWWDRKEDRQIKHHRDWIVKQDVFSLWVRRARTRALLQDGVLIADTIRETVLLLCCLRRWRARKERKKSIRLSTSILEELELEKTCRYCFEKWKRRTFPVPRTPLVHYY
ncbi:hypothetical protein ADEAN_000412200 [Angomonas deanei]|uniref:Sfi1 spindle body protein n=1 Tax=Angomonas deanei TaxID=59799 RepID=A0A7G2C9X3_9TRYP|nr:hypothetical protein ADEAN_000412200 [Angomonas deanei]